MIEFSGAWTDSKDQAISAGAYALVYAVQPAIKEHRGVSELRDVLVLVAAREFAASAGIDGLVEASRRVSGSGHPAVLALLPPPPAAGAPGVVREDAGRLILEVQTGGIPLALILVRAANSPRTGGFDRQLPLTDNQGRNAGRAALSSVWKRKEIRCPRLSKSR